MSLEQLLYAFITTHYFNFKDSWTFKESMALKCCQFEVVNTVDWPKSCRSSMLAEKRESQPVSNATCKESKRERVPCILVQAEGLTSFVAQVWFSLIGFEITWRHKANKRLINQHRQQMTNAALIHNDWLFDLQGLSGVARGRKEVTNFERGRLKSCQKKQQPFLIQMFGYVPWMIARYWWTVAGS